MKKLLVYILIAACVLGVTACGRAPEQEEDVDLWDTVAGKTFMYEKEGAGSEFCIHFYEDGDFQYYEGRLASSGGMGEWTLDGDVLIITQKCYLADHASHVNRFRVEDGGLTYLAEESANFLYVKVADGERFEWKDEDPSVWNHEA